MKKFSIFFLFLALLASPACSEVIVLKSGEEVEGEIFKRTDTYIEVDLKLGFPLTYYLDEIHTIDGSIVSPKPPQIKAKAPEKSTPKAQPVRTPIKRPIAKIISEAPTPKAPPMPVAPVLASNEDKEAQVKKLEDEFGRLTKETHRQSTAEALGGSAMMMGLMLLAYLAFTYPLFIIAQKTQTDPASLALIPIAQFYLMCKIAGRPGWWTILFFVPIVSFVIPIMVWMDIAEKRGKPKWMGVLMLIPGVNLALPFYLAFAGD